MPIFEYRCEDCDHHFEAIVYNGKSPHCPSCAGERLEKQLSVFAVGAATSARFSDSPAPGPCGSCGDPRGPGACSLN